MHANSFGINHQRVSPYESIMCKDFFAKSLIPQRHGGGGRQVHNTHRIHSSMSLVL